MRIEVCSVHLVRRLALLTDGQMVPVANLIDEDGDDTDILEFAVGFRAGPDKQGRYHMDSLETYGFHEKRTVN